MTKNKIKTQDLIFLLFFFIILFFYILTIRHNLRFHDEAFYPSVTLRLINGEHLLKDEWHLSQFSALFLYLPVRIFSAIKGSTDGLLLYLRCLFLCMHSFATGCIYTCFQKSGYAAVLAAILYFTQIPMNIMSISYNSLFAFFLVLFFLLLFSLCRQQHPIAYLLAGFCYGCACVCNPFFCSFFFIYCILCFRWKYLCSDFHRTNIHSRNLIRKKQGEKLISLPQNLDLQEAFFCKKAVFWLSCGLFLIAVTSLVFFFATGGSLSSVSENLKYLLSDSEHDVFNSPSMGLLNRIAQTAKTFNTMSNGLFFLPIVFYITLFFDKKRKNSNHTIAYLSGAIILALLYTVGAIQGLDAADVLRYFWSFPFFIVSSTAYILTQKKNKKLFYTLWLPGICAAVTQYLASNLQLCAISWVLSVANIAGLFFVTDLFKELSSTEKIKKAFLITSRALLCFGICLQFALQIIVISDFFLPNENDYRPMESGSLSGIQVNRSYYGTYYLIMQDLDKIKCKSEENNPILLVTEICWPYLEIDRPFASYSAWMNSFNPERLKEYYDQNPDNIPKYIYICAADSFNKYGINFKNAEAKADVMKEMFNCAEEKLSRGILLTVLE